MSRIGEMLKLHGRDGMDRNFLTGSALIRKQPSFWRACEIAFTKCCDKPGDHISGNKLKFIHLLTNCLSKMRLMAYWK
ncbi:hypothetical protein ZIOFF_046215 [Zingiber officinale]|uniref:Uncharacterized protein n=1 Tax=Zingiber officinale TaxID=94328 RepID=A0A8J5FZU5_ZINOF|nr:hypothetical protein ZIOFF_046215 [Zingiber officinale]